MIPVLFENNATSFNTNGLCRLRDMIEARATEERNGVFELDFTYPVNGAHFADIIAGRIVCATHDDTGDVQPFEIVSATRPIDGVVSFHAVHISYRQSQMTVAGTNVQSLADAFTLLQTAEPANPFTYWTDKTNLGYLAAADGTPRSVRQFLGGSEGSILDVYGGEYEWDGFTVKLHSSRGQTRDFAIRYGVNLLEYNDETDYQGTFTSCTAFWKNQDGDIITATATLGENGYNGNDIRVALDLSDRFEEMPTAADLQTVALAYMRQNHTAAPLQNIKVNFVRLADVGEFDDLANLLTCQLCDTVRVIFPAYNVQANFKIVRVVWDVLGGRYLEMELGDLSQSLSEALGLSSSFGGAGSSLDFADYVVEQGREAITGGVWRWREWNTGKVEMWYAGTITLGTSDSSARGVYRRSEWVTLPNSYALNDLTAIVAGLYSGEWYGCGGKRNANDGATEPYSKIQVMAYSISSAPLSTANNVNIYVCGQK